MKLFLLFASLTFLFGNKPGIWGATGHRVIGDIAEQYLTPAARAEVGRIMGNESLAVASTWMDEIRSDSSFDYTHDWHWVTIPEGMTYRETQKNPNGDIIKTITDITTALKTGGLTIREEREHIRMLVHLIGDIHQPLHVGTGEDRGGSTRQVRWFGEPSNLHRVWDSDIIDHTRYSYTELSETVHFATPEQIGEWQNSGVLDWAYESMELREQVYDLPEDNNLSYEYVYKYYDIVERRLLQAGIRLAGVLNDIYGS